MALHDFTEQERNLPFSFNYATFSAIADRMQMRKAKRQATKAERANKTLTVKQKLIAWTQLGGIVRYKAISYTTYSGQGVLMIDNKPHTINATFMDFVELCRKKYGVRGSIKLQAVKP